jgi:hypothetical protein
VGDFILGGECKLKGSSLAVPGDLSCEWGCLVGERGCFVGECLVGECLVGEWGSFVGEWGCLVGDVGWCLVGDVESLLGDKGCLTARGLFFLTT